MRDGEDDCPVEVTFEVIGDTWTAVFGRSVRSRFRVRHRDRDGVDLFIRAPAQVVPDSAQG